jgi:hypothetical protein
MNSKGVKYCSVYKVLCRNFLGKIGNGLLIIHSLYYSLESLA